jgi:tetratricopeptide (TPR) repeat protein
LRLFKANIQLADEHLDEALETLDEMNKYLPDAFDAYSLRVEIYSQKKQLDKALEISEQAISRFPEDVNVVCLYLRTLVAAEKYDEAIALVEKMKENGTYEVVIKQAVIQESAAYTGKGDIEKASEVLDNALEKIGEDEDLLYISLGFCNTCRKFDKVLQLSEHLLKVTHNEEYIPTAQFSKANALDALGRETEAKEEYRKLCSTFRKLTIANPGKYEVYILRLLCHTKLAEYDKALELADYLEAAKPESTDAYAFRYFIYKQKGDLDLADKEKEKALKINPDIIL